MSSVVSHRSHAIDRHPCRHDRNRKRGGLLIAHVAWRFDQRMFREYSVLSQDPIEGQTHPPRQFLFRNLTGLMVWEECRENAIADLPTADVSADLRDDAAHVGAWYKALFLSNGLVMGVLAINY